MTTHYSIGHSPDPDDAFMFYAMTESLIDTGDRRYEHVLVDIQTLNQQALEGAHDVSAVSIHSYPTISDDYSLMNCGASMGEGYGPMIISTSESSIVEASESTLGDETADEGERWEVARTAGTFALVDGFGVVERNDGEPGDDAGGAAARSRGEGFVK